MNNFNNLYKHWVRIWIDSVLFKCLRGVEVDSEDFDPEKIKKMVSLRLEIPKSDVLVECVGESLCKMDITKRAESEIIKSWARRDWRTVEQMKRSWGITDERG